MLRSSLTGKITLIILSIGLIAATAIWLYSVIPQVNDDSVMSQTDIKLTVIILLLVVSPFIALMMFLWHFVHTQKSLLVLLIGAFLITAFGVAAMADSILINPDAQSAMALFIVPVFQWIALILVVGICKYVKNLDNNAVETLNDK